MTAKGENRVEQFAREYAVDLNGKQAAIRAGYSPKTAESQASRLLRNVKVRAAIDAALAKAAERVEVKTDDILRELKRLAFVDLGGAYDDLGNLLPIKEIPEDVRRAIVGVKVFEEFEGTGRDRVKTGDVREVKLADKIRALELLGRYLKMWSENRLEITGRDGQPIQAQIEVFSVDPVIAVRVLSRLAARGALPGGAEGAGGDGDAEAHEVRDAGADRTAAGVPPR